MGKYINNIQLTKTSFTEKLCEEITFFSFCYLFKQELACDVKIEYWVDVRLYDSSDYCVYLLANYKRKKATLFDSTSTLK